MGGEIQPRVQKHSLYSLLGFCNRRVSINWSMFLNFGICFLCLRAFLLSNGIPVCFVLFLLTNFKKPFTVYIMPKTKSKKKAPKKSTSHQPLKNGRLIVLVFLLIAVLLLAFSVLHPKKAAAPSMQSAPVTYEGTTPCADCSGIKTVLTLSENPNVYTESFTYIGRDTSYTESGTWSIATTTGETPKTVITLMPTNNTTGSKTQYQVLSNTEIRQLDGNGNDIPESLPFNLKKVK